MPACASKPVVTSGSVMPLSDNVPLESLPKQAASEAPKTSVMLAAVQARFVIPFPEAAVYRTAGAQACARMGDEGPSTRSLRPP
jgi:hypothetical protein